MPTVRSARYVDVLALPHALPTFGSALIARSAYAIVILPLIFAVQSSTGSAATAGLAVGVYGAGAAFLAPLRARIIDRYGRPRVLTVLAMVFGAMLASLAVAALLDANGAMFITLAALAGAFAPPIGPAMRVVWSELTGDPATLRTALSLDAVLEEVLYLIGPAAAGLALTIIAPGIALVVPAVLVIVGTVSFVLSPVVRRAPAAPTSTGRTDSAPKARRRSLLAGTAYLAVLLPSLLAGMVSGNLTISMPELLTGPSAPVFVGIALGLFAGGSAVGGLVFGAITTPGPPHRQLVVLTVLLLGTSTVVGFASGAVWICLAIVIAGCCFSPVMVVAYLAAAGFGGDDRRTEATTWVNTAHNVGGSVGTALAGLVIQVSGAQASFIVTGAIGIVVVMATMLLVSARAPDDGHADRR
ncbi:MFS transporter [Plantibacter sp. YIM 135347]|uniref:MFS transporter n=1 Tax=Plantibacter sp. YIM 135347 TaxID=3423919 RepID=UPI003D339461